MQTPLSDTMKSVVLAAAWVLVVMADPIIYTPESEEEANEFTLPDGFLFGAGTSSYQVEGAWNVSGKGMSVFDKHFNIDVEHPDPSQNGNVAADSYHHVDDDIEMIRRLKLQIYRFSISWARLLPDGDASKPNPDGVRYYNEIIDKLRAINVEPLVTLYHFDHPQVLHERYGSWYRRDMISKFVEYADFAFKTFGDRVTFWTTFNEPNSYCGLVTVDMMAPGKGIGNVLVNYLNCVHYQLLAHGRAYRLYQKKYKATQKGKIGLTCMSGGSLANSTATADIQKAEKDNAIAVGQCAGPAIFGNYPEIVIRQTEELSKTEGFATSVLPDLTEEEKSMLKDSLDFLGLNVYSGQIVSGDSGSRGGPRSPRGGREGSGGIVVLSRAKIMTLPSSILRSSLSPASAASSVAKAGRVLSEKKGLFLLSPHWKQHGLGSATNGVSTTGGSLSLHVMVPGQGGTFPSQAFTPWAMEGSLIYVVNSLKNIPVIITENGFEDPGGKHDQNRAAYHSAYLRTMVKTMKERGAKVLAVTAWALIDTFEWSRGYSPKMGMVHIDYTSPNRTRSLKDSSDFYIKMMQERRVPLVPVIPFVTEQPKPASGAPQSLCSCFLFIGTPLLLSRLVI